MAPWWRARSPVDESRWVVLDVEASGLDPAQDRLLAVAAIGVRVDWRARRLGLVLADSFEAVLRQQEPSDRDNILLHGIGAGQQLGGVPADEALRAFAAFAGSSPLLAFHASFDRTLVLRHAAGHARAAPAGPWLDIEQLCGATHPSVRARSLDEWMAHFGIQCAARHQAAADTLAECELLQRIWPAIARQCKQWRDVEKLAGHHRWVGRA